MQTLMVSRAGDLGYTINLVNATYNDSRASPSASVSGRPFLAQGSWRQVEARCRCLERDAEHRRCAPLGDKPRERSRSGGPNKRLKVPARVGY